MTFSIDAVVRECTDQVKAGLRLFVEHKMHEVYGQGWEQRVSCQLVDGIPHWDLQALLKTIVEHWQVGFEKSLPRTARNLVFELKDWRNHVAHEHEMTLEDTSRFVDTAARLLKIIGVPQATELEALRLSVYHAVIANASAVHDAASYSTDIDQPAVRHPRLASEVSHPRRRQVHIAGAPSWQACVERLSTKVGADLKSKSGRCAFSADNSYGVCCLVSKQYEGQRFWWNLRERQLRALTDVHSAFVAFACGSSDSVVLIPLQDFSMWLHTFNPKPGEDGDGWHIHILHDMGHWWLLQVGRDNRIDITQYII